MAMEEKAYTVEQVATMLQVHGDTIRGWLRRGILRGTKLGKLWRIPEAELERIRRGGK